LWPVRQVSASLSCTALAAVVEAVGTGEDGK
jgi:hypothetical protein